MRQLHRRALSWWRLVAAVYLLAMLSSLLAPAVASAAAVNATTNLLNNPQLWVLVIGGLVPLVTYVINHVGPWMSEPVKAFIVALAAAIAGALFTALDTHVFGLNASTVQLVLSAVVAAFTAHKLIWLPSGVSTLLGGGSNARRVTGGPITATTGQPAAPQQAPPTA